MLLSRVSFIPHHDHEEAELVAVAESYLGSLVTNGQICGEYVKGWTDGVLCAYVYLSHRTAARSKYLSEWGRHSLAAVELQFGSEPDWEILDDNASSPVPTLKSASSLFLFTHSMTSASPVRHGDRGTSLPVFQLPIGDCLRQEIFLWSRAYSHHEGLWHDSDEFEMAAYRQLSDPASSLCKSGRQLCLAIEEHVDIPVYLYLLNHFGSKFGDPPGCPICGEDWFVSDSPFPSREPFHRFHFRCDACRLVSHRPVIDSADQQDPAEATTDVGPCELPSERPVEAVEPGDGDANTQPSEAPAEPSTAVQSSEANETLAATSAAPPADDSKPPTEETAFPPAERAS